MTIEQIKALFQTGKIPTQADFENLINKIPNNDSMGEGDNTLNLTNPSNPNILGYRKVSLNNILKQVKYLHKLNSVIL